MLLRVFAQMFVIKKRSLVIPGSDTETVHLFLNRSAGDPGPVMPIVRMVDPKQVRMVNLRMWRGLLQSWRRDIKMNIHCFGDSFPQGWFSEQSVKNNQFGMEFVDLFANQAHPPA